jgi:ribosomal protein S18 acetylase RimI-like enzyme
MPELRVQGEFAPEEYRELVAGLVEYNVAQVGSEGHDGLLVTLREGGKLLGGVGGYNHWGWLYLSHVWLDDTLRGQGWGRKLVEAAEAEGRTRGCLHVHLDTFSFQALPFYRALGYAVFGHLDDYPAGTGHTRYFLKKDLAS